ncbi:MAG: phosphoenolpyruvate---glycerone phosphotransferase subunit DhaK [Microbacteriaceae bacterium]|jgi:dihydroxyacetone kinase-like protein|nr:phosphoenolpyruvate---glycerone phosphotransferase subunit DhaK [Microbacteriaceae bacterium]
MKKLINDARAVVDEALGGLAAAHADILSVSFDPRYVARRGAPIVGKVALVSGGGSGHEPLHAGFVGLGMLAAAVPGAIFTSPTPDLVLAATRAVDGGTGVLYLVKNYTGDVLNFETAADLAVGAGIRVESVLINDDVAVEDSSFTAGRRGIAGAVLVEKIAGAAAERGDFLESVASIARRVNASMRSMGVGLRAGVLPYSGESTFTLAEDEIEFGVGMHGEPGRARIPLEPADAIVDRLVAAIADDLPFAPGDRVLLLVNGLGGTPQSELYIVFRRAAQALAERGLVLTRSLVGSFATSLEMQGASLTLLRLDDELVELWDAPVHTAALRWGC